MGYYFSNEIVFAGHPDKVCDQISDAILDAYISQDKESRCGIETVGGKGKIFITGEVTSKAQVNVEEVVRQILKEVGYSTDYEIINNIGQQSPNIAQGVDIGGAGDQGMMFGYACRDTPQMLPTAMVILQEFSRQYDKLRKTDHRFLPDGKAQITGWYEDGKLKHIHDFTISYQNTEVEREETDSILRRMATEIAEKYNIFFIDSFHINPTGKFLIGGFDGDAGLTGRKIVVDAYQSFANVGGGAFCVDSETEYLTPQGFKKISDYDENDLVGQWNNGYMEFIKPYAYIKTKAEKMYHITTNNSLDMVLSENHDMVIKTSKGNIIKKPVKELFDKNGLKNGNHGFIPTSFKFNNFNKGIVLSDNQIRLQVAFCADGTMSNNKYRVRLKKPNKISRIKDLLNKTGTKFAQKMYNDGYSYFLFEPPIKSKSLKECFSDCNYNQMEVVAEEVQKWDGTNKIFRTTNKTDADFIQFVFASVFNTEISIGTDDRIGSSYSEKYIRKSICYEVRIKNNIDVSIRHGDKCKITCELFEPKDGLMYCFTVPSGMLVLRRNNKIFITGNCGKDPTKVDRSAAYKARQIAIECLTEKPDINWCEVQLSYAIGIEQPLAIYIKTDKGIYDNVSWLYAECAPQSIIEDLDLKNVKYYKTAKYGHFGNKEFNWEKGLRI